MFSKNPTCNTLHTCYVHVNVASYPDRYVHLDIAVHCYLPVLESSDGLSA